VIQAEEIGQVSVVTPAATEPVHASVVTSATTEVGDDPTAVMEVALMTCQ
jgi:hypothetical protein